ncbi:MAG: hypothetical protein QOK14_1816, partial [Frankiaceae bacterium]|nr:hypothetical protein [Frankiaceae bacterium]
VHSGYLQPLNDGGLLLGLPFLLACVLVVLGLLRRLGRAAWTAENGLVSLVATGSLVLAAHSALDFDWTYPSLMAMNALLAAVALSWSSPRGGTRQASNRSSVPAFAVLAAAAVLLAIPAVRGGWTLSAHPNTPDTTFLHGVSAP